MAVGFFTQDIEFALPHPPIQQRTILLICKVIRKAWELLVATPPTGFVLHAADEDTITQLLAEIIENRLRKNGEVGGFDKVQFGKVIREPKITNYNKEHPDKMPDIFFDLKREEVPIISDQDGLFVECKPVDTEHPVFSCYCQKGLIRFVNGDYAWAMQDALMVGYVSGNYSFEKLASVLSKEESADLKTVDHFPRQPSMYRSNHERDFMWLDGRGQACRISVSHFWLTMS